MENDEEEEDEEEKIQKFFALLRSTRDVRNRIMRSADKSREGAGKRKGGEEKLAVQVWIPSFQPEDFMEGADHHQSDKAGPQSSLGGSKREDEAKEGEKEGGNDGLDLKLSL